MKLINEFKNVDLARGLALKLKQTVRQPITIMEVCGTHTMAIFRHGLRSILPEAVSLTSGPGCPVCVTPQGYIDRAISMTAEAGVILTTFGDMIRVKGTHSSLLQEKDEGRDIRIVYSPLDAVEIARANPAKRVVFLGVGFETTAPVVALSIKQAISRGVGNYCVYSAHKTVPPAMAALVEDPDVRVDGFLCPGHVSTIIGLEPYHFLAEQYQTPAVIAGFEATDILHGLLALAQMINTEKPAVLNGYGRMVKDEGNPAALAILAEVFTAVDGAWRGLGLIPGSGLAIRKQFAGYDAGSYFNVEYDLTDTAYGCQCGEILKGKKAPPECALFKTVCTPENPVGACMVSGEGTCAAYYKYDGIV